ncbi:MAG: DUF3000 family protein [Streptosporangiaceae bacterium]
MSTHPRQPGRSGPAERGQHPPDNDEFRHAVAEVELAMTAQRQLRAELRIETETPPRRLAPFAYAVAAAVSATPGDPESEIGWGRFVLLFDAASQPGWDGKHRIIGYVRAELEPEMATDPLINEVGWSWLTEALDSRTTGYRNISGTVTTVVTQGFGGKQDEPTSTSFELRASWSPGVTGESSAGLAGHVAAWCDVVCVAAGLPPLAPGVAALRPPRRGLRP